MKKHDEGYVLAFVMVVIVVLCLVAVSLMSVSLRNLEAQNASIQRMEHKYAAMGEIEKVVAKIDSDVTFTSTKNSAIDSLEEYLGMDIPTYTFTVESDVITHFTVKLPIVGASGSVKIDTTITWDADIRVDGDVYKITNPLVMYDSYQISTIETG